MMERYMAEEEGVHLGRSRFLGSKIAGLIPYAEGDLAELALNERRHRNQVVAPPPLRSLRPHALPYLYLWCVVVLNADQLHHAGL